MKNKIMKQGFKEYIVINTQQYSFCISLPKSIFQFSCRHFCFTTFNYLQQSIMYKYVLSLWTKKRNITIITIIYAGYRTSVWTMKQRLYLMLCTKLYISRVWTSLSLFIWVEIVTNVPVRPTPALQNNNR